MSEIAGYLLTKKEEEACVALIKEMREKKMRKVDFYYFVVLYDGDIVIPIPFNTLEKADNYIWKHRLHAYITIDCI